jgi:hypothetical protein
VVDRFPGPVTTQEEKREKKKRNLVIESILYSIEAGAIDPDGVCLVRAAYFQLPPSRHVPLPDRPPRSDRGCPVDCLLACLLACFFGHTMNPLHLPGIRPLTMRS